MLAALCEIPASQRHRSSRLTPDCAGPCHNTTVTACYTQPRQYTGECGRLAWLGLARKCSAGCSKPPCACVCVFVGVVGSLLETDRSDSVSDPGPHCADPFCWMCRLVCSQAGTNREVYSTRLPHKQSCTHRGGRETVWCGVTDIRQLMSLYGMSVSVAAGKWW